MAIAPLQVAAVIVAVALVLLLAWRVWRDPFALVRAEYARQRRSLGLSRISRMIDGQRWVHVERGPRTPTTPTLVMLHGYTGSKENWYSVAKRLPREYRILIPDLPGWGESQRDPGADYGYAAQAARVAAFIRASCDGPVVLLGHSMGGGIAAVVAGRTPELVAKVVLLNASGVHFADNQFGLDVLDGHNPFAVTDRDTLKRYLGTIFHDVSALPPMPWPVPRIVIAQRLSQGDFEQSVLDHIGRGPDQFLPGDEAGRIRQPALLIWGAQDRVIDPSAMQLFAARMPQARTLLVDGSGHMTPMERPGIVADAVMELING